MDAAGPAPAVVARGLDTLDQRAARGKNDLVLGLQLVVALGVAILVAHALARRVPVPVPAILVLAGSALFWLPGFDHVGLPPEVVLLLFLPALLYWEAITSSARHIRKSARGIVLTGTLLVVVTAAVVAVVANALGVPWGLAWIIGAALAPTDATAVAALRRLLPRRNLGTLQADSLINDGTALVVYGLAVAFAAEGRMPSAGEITGQFALSFFGGIAVGLVVGWVAHRVRSRIPNHVDTNIASVLTPFVAYLLAEEVHASGVLAVVTCGLYMARVTPRTVAAATRQQGAAFWTLSTTVLNAALFVLIGLQLPASVQRVAPAELAHDLLICAAVFATLPLVRWLFLTVSIGVIRALDRRPAQRALRTTWRGRVVSAVAGLRGGVSLAVALSVPDDLPGRHLVVFVTGTVVVASLLIQGSALPAVIRWAGLPRDTTDEDEYARAQIAASEAALESLDALAAGLDVDDAVADAARSNLEQHLRALAADRAGDEEAASVVRSRQARDLHLALLHRKRTTIIELRDQRVIDDVVLRRIQAQLDAEEVRLTSPETE